MVVFELLLALWIGVCVARALRRPQEHKLTINVRIEGGDVRQRAEAETEVLAMLERAFNRD